MNMALTWERNTTLNIDQTAVTHLPSRLETLRQKSKELEIAFLSEMLAHSGLDKTLSAQGGMGADHYASFVRTEFARAIVERDGLGMAETLFNALLKTEVRNG